MKVLLIGKSGQLGSSILQVAGQDIEFLSPDRDELDLRSSSSVAHLIRQFKPDAVINTAAFHDLPACERMPLEAFQVNCVAVYELARICCREQVRLITFSSDYVFSGDKVTPYCEYDLPGPLQIYGISRLAGENAAMAAAPEHAVIIRTCGLYGLGGARSKGGNFIDKRLADAGHLDELEMSCDQVVSPTYSMDLARAVVAILEDSGFPAGLYHLVNEGQCSWYEFTTMIFQVMGISTKVIPVDRKGRSGEMRRPAYSALANTRARERGITMPPWQDGLGRYLKDKYGADYRDEPDR